jgi:hypothetical protein
MMTTMDFRMKSSEFIGFKGQSDSQAFVLFLLLKVG